MPTLADRISVSPDVLSREVGGETVLLDLKGEGYYGLDPIGTHIWQQLQAGGDLRTIRDRICAEYDVDPQTLEIDLLRLVEELMRVGLISVLPGPAEG